MADLDPKTFEQVFQSLKAGDQLALRFKSSISNNGQEWFDTSKTYNGIVSNKGISLKIYYNISGGALATQSLLKDDFLQLINPTKEDYCTIID